MNKKFKIFLIVITSILIYCANELHCYINNKKIKVEIELDSNLTLEVNDKRNVSSYIKSINGIIVNDYIIDSSKVGLKKVNFEYVHNNDKFEYSYNLNIVDTTSPIAFVNNIYNVRQGEEFNYKKILCGDNYDNTPNCYIEGYYDTNKIGIYNLKYIAIDNSGNEFTKDFKLNVFKDTNNEIKKDKIIKYNEFSDIKSLHKKNNTRIGIDVSSWQGDIDFEKIKNTGVEFIFIRVGYSKGTNGEYILDKKFKQNIEGANKYNIPVGIYFYSYADDEEHAINDARWVLEQIKDYKVELPIVFDWENWNEFNEYKISFQKLNDIAFSFISEIEKNGYISVLYSSKKYLDNIWFNNNYSVWLAHYTDKTNYNGEYNIWQICDNGLIDGIDTYVDIDIMYE